MGTVDGNTDLVPGMSPNLKLHRVLGNNHFPDFTGLFAHVGNPEIRGHVIV